MRSRDEGRCRDDGRLADDDGRLTYAAAAGAPSVGGVATAGEPGGASSCVSILWWFGTTVSAFAKIKQVQVSDQKLPTTDVKANNSYTQQLLLDGYTDMFKLMARVGVSAGLLDLDARWPRFLWFLSWACC